MLVAIITDTHFGIRGDNQIVQDYIGEFYEKCFFPEITKRGIKTILHGGDVFDRRKYVNFQTLKKTNECFINKISELDLSMHVILGNHDVFYKGTNDVNSLRELLSNKKGITVYEKPTEIQLDSLKIMLLPWINENNLEEFTKEINNSTATWLLGHLELDGFEMHKGQICEHGMSPKLFSKFERVLTGHFHTQSRQGDIQYLGSPYEMTWIDYDDHKGFYILDTETRELEFIKNPISLHFKMYYNDELYDYNHAMIDNLVCDYKNKMVKLIVEKKTNHTAFDKVVDAINKVGPLNFTIVEDMSIEVSENEEVMKDVGKDTLTLINEYIDDIQKEIETDHLKIIMKNLYNEAMQ